MLEEKQIDLVIEIAFQNATERWSSHSHHIETLKTNYSRSNPDDFYNLFIKHLELILKSKTNPAMSNALQFAALFIIKVDDDEETCPFLLKIFEFLCQKHEAENANYRTGVCCLFDLLMNGMKDIVLTKSMHEKMSKILLTMTDDESSEVRVQAVNALQRLQQSEEKNCPIEDAYIDKLSNDPNPDVQKAVVKNLRRSKKSLDAVIKQLTNSNEGVKKEAYIFLCKMTPNNLDAKIRRGIIKSGLNDCDKIVDIIREMLLPIWYPNYVEDILVFLKNLDVVSDPTCCRIIFRSVLANIDSESLIKQLPIDSTKKLIPIKALTAESVFFWVGLINHLLKEGHVEAAGTIAPEFGRLCRYINDFRNIALKKIKDDCDNRKDLFILSQLIVLTKIFTLVDKEPETLRLVLVDILSSNFHDAHFIIKTVEYYKTVVQDFPSRIDGLSRIIGRVQRLDTDEEKFDTKTMLKCLAITHIMMQGTAIKEITPEMKKIFNETILPSVDHQDILVQKMAIKSAGSWLLLDSSLAKKHFRRFINFFFITIHTPSERWVLVLNMIFNLFEKYGLDFFSLSVDDAEMNQEKSKFRDVSNNYLKCFYSNENIIKFLVGLINHRVPAIKNSAVQGFQNLIDQGKIKSSWIIERLEDLKKKAEKMNPSQLVKSGDVENVERLDVSLQEGSETPVAGEKKMRKRRILLSESLEDALAIETKPINWRGSIRSPDIDEFSVCTREIFGPSKDAISDLSDHLSIIGFLDHATVWKSIAEMQESYSNQILIIRLVPEKDDDKKSYITFHAYLNNQKKCGLVGNVPADITHIYMLALSSETMVPKFLLPMIGDELQRDESEEILLGIIILQSKQQQSETPVSLTCHEELLELTPEKEGGPGENSSIDLNQSTLSGSEDFDESNNDLKSTPRLPKRKLKASRKFHDDYVCEPSVKKKTTKPTTQSIKKEIEEEELTDLATKSIKKEPIDLAKLPEAKVVLRRLDDE